MEPNFFWSTNRRIKKYINALRIDSAISELRISWYSLRLKPNISFDFNLTVKNKKKNKKKIYELMKFLIQKQLVSKIHLCFKEQ